MDFSGRGAQPPQTGSRSSSPEGTDGVATTSNKKSNGKSRKSNKLVRVGAGILGLLVLALVVALICAIAFGSKKEASYVDDTKLQAVFLQTGQVYFGKIQSLNNNYLVLDDIYYLQTSTGDTAAAAKTTDTNVSLVKLGCELHSPYDRMVINHDQVTFWENLQESGQVAKAVATFKKDNPNGQKCSEQTAAPNSSTNVQGTTPSTTDTNN